jgi:hypothetical protein
MKVNLDPAQVGELYRKNTQTSYGLTFVVGLPFPSEIADAIAGVQRKVDEWLPDRFRWYGLDHLHASIYAPLRSQNRPLRRDDLPPNLDDFARDLGDVISHWQPFTLALAGAQLGQDGALSVGEDNLERRLVSCLSSYPNTATPKHIRGLTPVIGFLTTAEPFSAEEEKAHFEQELANLRDLPIGRMEVDRVWLVHYGHRTLSHVIGKLPFELGRKPSRVLTGAELLAALGMGG